MKMTKSLVAALGVSCLTGCAHQAGNRGYGANWEPVVDVRQHQQAQYPSDLSQCQAHATKVIAANDAAVQGAIAGAIFGALLGAAAGGNSRFNSQMAGVGALSGGTSAAVAAEGGQRGIISRCLAGRGYSVLN
jgi:outer membrane lipoprotein SlyB